jgi:hypothetical protein
VLSALAMATSLAWQMGVYPFMFVSPQTCLVIFDFAASCAFDLLAVCIEWHPAVFVVSVE